MPLLLCWMMEQQSHVARYRKEATGGLDDTQLRTLHSRLVI